MAKYIPQAHAKFNAWQKQLLQGLLTNPATKKAAPFPPAPGAAPANWQKWAIPQADMEALVDAQAAYQPTYDEWSDEDARSKAISQAHKTARKTYEKHLRLFVAQWLRHNSKVKNAGKASLGLTVPDTKPTAVTVVDHGPLLSIDTIYPLVHIIRVKNSETPESSAMPKGHKVNLERFIGPAGLKGKDIKWGTTYKRSGRFLIRSEFTDKEKGLTAYYRARYVSTRGEFSVHSSVLEIIIA